MPPLRPLDSLLARARAEALMDGVVTRAELQEIATLARDSGATPGAVKPALQPLVDLGKSTFESAEAFDEARAWVNAPRGERTRPDNDLFRYVGAPGTNTVRMHELSLKRDGVFDGNTGLRSYSRGWGQFNAGVLSTAHGSPVPSSSIHDDSARAALQNLPPAARLDAAMEAFGVRLPMNDFSSLAAGFNHPDQPDWAGVCYSWSWAALDARLAALVDVKGPEGERGVWIGGQFLSRADLGNWLMALAAGLSQGAGDVMWYAPEGDDLVKACLGYLMEGGTGFRADIGNSFLDRPNEIWFQPFVGAKVEIGSVDDATAAGILDVVRQPRKAAWGGSVAGVEGASVKLVTLTGRYGNEESDDWEAEPVISEMTWSIYAVLDDSGKLLKAVMADDPRIAQLSHLPARTTAPVPRELFAPEHTIVDGILQGEPAPEVKGSVYGPALNFFVGHVLARGVPAHLRAAFEAEPALAGLGSIGAEKVAALRERYPTMANAYGPEEWQSRFAARGLDAAVFGAPEFAGKR